MSAFGQAQMQAIGQKSSTVIYHCADSCFRPLDKAACRKAIGLPLDKFIIGSVAVNKGPRKNLFGQLQAFALFHAKHPDSIFYLHCIQAPDRLHREAYDLTQVVQALGLEGSVFFTDALSYELGLSDDDMCRLYNCFDVLTECSFAEGAGLPILEAQACGVPVVGTDFSAIPEMLPTESPLLVPVSEKIALHNLGVFHGVPSGQGIVQAYERVYDEPSMFYRQKALEKAHEHTENRWKQEWLSYITNLQATKRRKDGTVHAG